MTLTIEQRLTFAQLSAFSNNIGIVLLLNDNKFLWYFKVGDGPCHYLQPIHDNTIILHIDALSNQRSMTTEYFFELVMYAQSLDTSLTASISAVIKKRMSKNKHSDMVLFTKISKAVFDFSSIHADRIRNEFPSTEESVEPLLNAFFVAEFMQENGQIIHNFMAGKNMKPNIFSALKGDNQRDLSLILHLLSESLNKNG